MNKLDNTVLLKSERVQMTWKIVVVEVEDGDQTDETDREIINLGEEQIAL